MLAAVAWLFAAAPGVARAASAKNSDGGSAGELTTVVIVVLVIGVAYVLAHNVVERLQRRFLVVSGAEYLFLGILLGPTFALNVFEGKDNMTGLLPVIALAAGWVGLPSNSNLVGPITFCHCAWVIS